MTQPLAHWEEDPNYPTEDWTDQVIHGDTRLGYHDWVAKQYRPDEPTKLEHTEDLLFELARLVRNTDGLHPSTWGVKAGAILLKIRALNEPRYQQEILPAEDQTVKGV